MTEYPIKKTEAQWREQLDAEQFSVTRQATTERAFTGQYWDHFQDGIYHCVCCSAKLFDAKDKFDAGCGWPSYSQALNATDVQRVTDTSHGMQRIEVRCQQCGAHLGHVFNDGPQPHGERFCINSAALAFQVRK